MEHHMVVLQTWAPEAQVLAAIVGYAVAGLAFIVYSKSNIRSMSFLGTGLALESTPVLLAHLYYRGVEIPNILLVNYILVFGGFSFIAYAIVLQWKE
jgi:hypothetical protein